MRGRRGLCVAAAVAVLLVALPLAASGDDAPLPAGVKAVWDLDQACRKATATSERISINGLWRWQPADEVGPTVPADNWGYYKVPGPWSANSQTLYPHPAWKNRNLRNVGILVALSQPHCQHYKWGAPEADKRNRYARHAAFYVRVAGNHPAVVMYSMNHNALSYYGDTDPDLTDGRHNAEGRIGPRTDRGALNGLKAQAIVERLDPTRVVYHHSSGTLGHTHTNKTTRGPPSIATAPGRWACHSPWPAAGS